MEKIISASPLSSLLKLPHVVVCATSFSACSMLLPKIAARIPASSGISEVEPSIRGKFSRRKAISSLTSGSLTVELLSG